MFAKHRYISTDKQANGPRSNTRCLLTIIPDLISGAKRADHRIRGPDTHTKNDFDEYGGLKKGVIIDILNGRDVFASADSKYGFTPVRWACESVKRRIDETGVIEIGARDAITLGSMAEALNSQSVFRGARDDQVFENAPTDAPPAVAAVDFARGLRLASGENND